MGVFVIKKVKKCIISLVAKVLGRAVQASMRLDNQVKREAAYWKDGFTIVIEAYKGGPKIILVKNGERLLKKKQVPDDEIDLYIIFKTMDSAFELFTGQIGIDKAYAENRMLIKGDIFQTMPFVRIVYICEYYLFPKLIWRRIMDKPKTTSNCLFIYGGTLLGLK